MDKIQKWLLSPSGMIFSRIISAIVKAILVLLSARIPSLGIGKDIDAVVAELAPLITVSLIIWWTAKQGKKTEKRVKKALMTPPPSSTPLE